MPAQWIEIEQRINASSLATLDVDQFSFSIVERAMTQAERESSTILLISFAAATDCPSVKRISPTSKSFGRFPMQTRQLRLKPVRF